MLRRIVGLAMAAATGLVLVVTVLEQDPQPEGAAPATTRSTAPPSPSSPPPVSGGAGGEYRPSLDDIVADLPLANVAFNAPPAMRLNEPVVIQLLLSGRRPINELKDELTALGEREGEQIRASGSMEAHLTGTGFAIEAITPAVQLAAGAGVTEWKWEVEPTKAGLRRLHLTLSAIIDVGGRDGTYTVRTFERTLDVRVSLRERLTNFVEANWQWMWTTLLIPLAGWVLQRRRRREEVPASAPTSR
ncbi:MAG: hypothetical protein ACXWZB_08935 [Gaiellaceae bacterium]